MGGKKKRKTNTNDPAVRLRDNDVLKFDPHLFSFADIGRINSWVETSDKIKRTVALGELVDFSGFELCWKPFGINESTQLNKTNSPVEMFWQFLHSTSLKYNVSKILKWNVAPQNQTPTFYMHTKSWSFPFKPTCWQFPNRLWVFPADILTRSAPAEPCKSGFLCNKAWQKAVHFNNLYLDYRCIPFFEVRRGEREH